jgi:hypothetical protein
MRRRCRREAPLCRPAPSATEPPHRPFHEHHADQDLLHELLAGGHNTRSGPSPARPSAMTAPTQTRISGEPLTSSHLELGPLHSGAPLEPPPQPVRAASSSDSGWRHRLPTPWQCLPLFRLSGPPAQERPGQFGSAGRFWPIPIVPFLFFHSELIQSSNSILIKVQTSKIVGNCMDSIKL